MADSDNRETGKSPYYQTIAVRQRTLGRVLTNDGWPIPAFGIATEVDQSTVNVGSADFLPFSLCINVHLATQRSSAPCANSVE